MHPSSVALSSSSAPSSQLMPPTKQDFEEKGYYTWLYEGPQALSNFMTFLIIAGFLAITCFPIWPHFLKVRRRKMTRQLCCYYIIINDPVPSLSCSCRSGYGMCRSLFFPSCSDSYYCAFWSSCSFGSVDMNIGSYLISSMSHCRSSILSNQ